MSNSPLILLSTGDAAYADSLRAALRNRGARVIVEEAGATVWLTSEMSPAVVLLDVDDSPSRLSVLADLRGRSLNEPMVIVLSARSGEDIHRVAAELRATAVVEKPVADKELDAIVQMAQLHAERLTTS